jgi:hypothetical protein
MKGGRRTEAEKRREDGTEIAKCEGQEDPVTFEPITEPQYAIRLLEDGHYFCFDVRTLHGWFKTGKRTNPSTNKKFTESNIIKIQKKFRKENLDVVNKHIPELYRDLIEKNRDNIKIKLYNQQYDDLTFDGGNAVAYAEPHTNLGRVFRIFYQNKKARFGSARMDIIVSNSIPFYNELKEELSLMPGGFAFREVVPDEFFSSSRPGVEGYGNSVGLKLTQADANLITKMYDDDVLGEFHVRHQGEEDEPFDINQVTLQDGAYFKRKWSKAAWQKEGNYKMYFQYEPQTEKMKFDVIVSKYVSEEKFDLFADKIKSLIGSDEESDDSEESESDEE